MFVFRLLPSRVATAEFPSPFGPIFCILLRHFSHWHIISHRTINLLLGLPRSLFPCRSILSILLPICPSLFPPYRRYMSKPHQSCLSCFLSNLSHPCCPGDVLIHSWSCPFLSLLKNIVTSSTLPPPSPPQGLSFRQCHRLQPVRHCWSHCHPVRLSLYSWSQIAPDILLQPFHPACTLFFTSLLHSVSVPVLQSSIRAIFQVNNVVSRKLSRSQRYDDNNKVQMPEVRHSLRLPLYFFPQITEDGEC